MTHPQPPENESAQRPNTAKNSLFPRASGLTSSILRPFHTLSLCAAAVAALPQFLGSRKPVGRIGVTLGAQVLRALRGLHIGGLSPSLFHHLPQLLRVLQHGAGAQMVLIEGLAVMIGHEHGRAQTLQQRFSRMLESE